MIMLGELIYSKKLQSMGISNDLIVLKMQDIRCFMKTSGKSFDEAKDHCVTVVLGSIAKEYEESRRHSKVYREAEKRSQGQTQGSLKASA